MIAPVFQPIVDAKSGHTVAAEVFARAKGRPESTKGPLSLSEIISWDWKDVDCKIMIQLAKYGEDLSKRLNKVFINVANETLQCDHWFSHWLGCVDKLIESTSTCIVLEITEQVEPDVLKRRWNDIIGKGVRIALDDFGNDHSTYERLASYNWDVCKYRSKDLQSDSPDVEKALRYCKDNGISIIAEQIETEEQKSIAELKGSHFHQGWLYAYPMKLHDLHDKVRNAERCRTTVLEPAV